MPSELEKIAGKLHARANEINRLAGFGGAGDIAQRTTPNSAFRQLDDMANGIGLKTHEAIRLINELIAGTNTGYESKAIQQLIQAKDLVVKVRAALNDATRAANIRPRTAQAEGRLNSAVSQVRRLGGQLAALLPTAAKAAHVDGTKLVPSVGAGQQPAQR